ncbi:MAG TPA: fructosamine kinase family protein, partial [Gallionellaceae bacterium]|nr:fructosamine kinase family protein [Gallionellaceae bacterium]
MSHWDDICAHIASASGSPCRTAHLVPVSGGYTSHVWHLSCDDGRELLVKLNSADKAAMYAAESAGLQALTASRTVTVPQVICHGLTATHAFLVMEFFDLHDHGDARLLGTQLAALHRVHGKQFGWDHDNTLGLTPQHNTWCDDWLTFWREQRLGFQLELAARNGFRGRLQTLGQQVIARL